MQILTSAGGFGNGPEFPIRVKLKAMDYFLAHWHLWVWSIGTVAGAILAGLLAHYLLYTAARRFASRTRSQVDEALVRHSSGPAKLILPLIAVLGVLPTLPLRPGIVAGTRHTVALALIAAIAWLLTSLLNVIDEAISQHYRANLQSNFEARRITTQSQVLRRIGVVIISFIALAAMMMTFPTIWNIGAGLFASAGVAGLVIGMAARPTLSNLLAGLQIALTQPMRLDDVVIVEGEWGRVEEIGTSYVVVRIWDLRRLVVPLSYFIEKPFQNWTRQSADLLGTVFLYVDYNVPVEEIRQQLHRVLQNCGMWDGKVWNLQVTDAKERTVELRAMMSAPNSGTAWDLRCHVREKMITYLQQQYPGSLPRMRAEIESVKVKDAVASLA